MQILHWNATESRYMDKLFIICMKMRVYIESIIIQRYEFKYKPFWPENNWKKHIIFMLQCSEDPSAY